jgi:hypothetical protein
MSLHYLYTMLLHYTHRPSVYRWFEIIKPVVGGGRAMRAPTSDMLRGTVLMIAPIRLIRRTIFEKVSWWT